MRRLRAVLLAAGVVVLVGASCASAAPGETIDLYHPGYDAAWAFVNAPVVALRSPSPHARAVARLGLRTQDGTAELVLLLARRTGSDRRPWVRVELPVRPIGSTGWVPLDALSMSQHTPRWVQIDTARSLITVISDGKTVFAAPVGTGRRTAPTPHGSFYIRDRLVAARPNGLYGPLAFGLSALSRVLTEWPGGGVIGIHGTNQPGLIPGRPSHGCIRMRNADIRRFAALVSVGDPVTIS